MELIVRDTDGETRLEVKKGGYAYCIVKSIEGTEHYLDWEGIPEDVQARLYGLLRELKDSVDLTARCFYKECEGLA